MIYRLSRLRKILLSMFTTLLVSLSCIIVTGQDPPADAQAPGGELILQTEMVYGPGDFNFPDTRAGLVDLSSYRATLTMSFEGTRDGSDQQWSKTYVMLVSTVPPARQLNVEKIGDISGPYPVFMAEAGGAAYERLGMVPCTASMIDPEFSLGERLEPVGLLIGVIGAEVAGNETVNGITAAHYTFDERALGQLDVTQSTGEIWVASDGGYIVKYVLTTSGNADYFGEGIEGTLTWDYELTDANQPVAIQLPEDCPSGMVNAPRLPDASNILDVPGLLTYDTASSVADAAAFYQQQIPDLGWTLAGKPAVTETPALLKYTQGDQTMTVIITTGDAGTEVRILLDRLQE